MKIGIIAGDISKTPAGLERYLFELISHIVKDTTHTYQIYVKSDKSTLHEFFGNKEHVEVISVGWGRLWKDIGLLFVGRSDTYLFTGPIGSLLFWPKKSVTIVYDFAYKYRRGGLKDWIEHFVIDMYSLKSFFSSQTIVCISEITKVDLIHFFPSAKEKTVVIYPGFNSLTQVPLEEILLPNGEFFLFIGTLKERKNVLNIIKGFEYFQKTYINERYDLFIAGKYSSDNSYYQALMRYLKERPELQSKVHFLGHISDGQLRYLYSRAVSLVYPSILEGFGLPVLEAMDSGLPVITSNLSSLKEAAGDGALLVDPYSIEEIGEAMKKMLDQNFRTVLIQKGYENTKRFSWDIMAREFLATITRV